MNRTSEEKVEFRRDETRWEVQATRWRHGGRLQAGRRWRCRRQGGGAAAGVPDGDGVPDGAACAPATKSQFTIFFAALYLTSIGTGGVKSALLPFGARYRVLMPTGSPLIGCSSSPSGSAR